MVNCPACFRSSPCVYGQKPTASMQTRQRLTIKFVTPQSCSHIAYFELFEPSSIWRCTAQPVVLHPCSSPKPAIDLIIDWPTPVTEQLAPVTERPVLAK